MGLIVNLISWIGASFLPKLVPFITSIFIQTAVTLGFSLLVVEGINVGLDYFVNKIDASFGGMPADIVGIMGLLGLDKAINIILTAHLFVLGLKGLSSRKYLPSWNGTGK
ncbi:hypothetical protein RJ45_10275 [Photobacterium gaetbulicola]|uniref:Cobalt ABC transporter permease n=1 Tax=Photobacterium gaetbulicola TaxID=1295392 RepID=A0A0B9G4V4_9GAMM|nr:DUF2523 family protein [Photobacterium gaetbulicola]KHT63728.1 hypothetical protein RJ45_10275 [Photobacterium gaetbulicola]